MSKTIAILGATGNQGSGLTHALLSEPTTSNDEHPHPDFKIRALTRSTTSPAAQSLQKTYPDPARLVLVQADVYDADSLRAAFKDADAVFAMTNNRKSGGVIETEDEMKHELVQGRNIVDAAKECKIPHLILSSLPDISRASHGHFTKVFHFDYKAQIEEWARRELPGVTALHPGLYLSNMNWPQYCRNENGIVRFCAPVSGHQRADWVDSAYDIGRYAAGPRETTPKTYPVVSPKLPFSELPRIFTQKTGIPAYFEPITLDEWGSTVAQAAGKGYETDIRQMMEWVAVAPDEKVCYGTMEPEMLHRAWEELGVRASSFEEWLERTRWRGPGSG